MPRPLPGSVLIMVGALLCLHPRPAGSDPDLLLPDLTTLGSYLQQYKVRRSQGRVRIHFPVPIYNRGRGALEMLGTRETDQEEMQATQVVYTADGQIQTFNLASWVYHDVHGHWHVMDVAEYRLLDQNGNVVASTPKVSFFLEDTKLIDRTLQGTPRSRVYRFHGRDRNRKARTLRTGISVGWADIYAASVPGQFIDVTGLPRGSYTLQVEVNPNGSLMESDFSNNTVSVPVTL